MRSLANISFLCLISIGISIPLSSVDFSSESEEHVPEINLIEDLSLKEYQEQDLLPQDPNSVELYNYDQDNIDVKDSGILVRNKRQYLSKDRFSKKGYEFYRSDNKRHSFFVNGAFKPIGASVGYQFRF